MLQYSAVCTFTFAVFSLSGRLCITSTCQAQLEDLVYLVDIFCGTWRIASFLRLRGLLHIIEKLGNTTSLNIVIRSSILCQTTNEHVINWIRHQLDTFLKIRVPKLIFLDLEGTSVTCHVTV